MGIKAHQEAHPIDCPWARLAPQQRSARCRSSRFQGLRLFGIRQGSRRKVSWRTFLRSMAQLNFRPEPTAWGEKLPFGTICGEFSSPNGGWVHDVAFSPSGNALAYVSK